MLCSGGKPSTAIAGQELSVRKGAEFDAMMLERVSD